MQATDTHRTIEAVWRIEGGEAHRRPSRGSAMSAFAEEPPRTLVAALARLPAEGIPVIQAADGDESTAPSINSPLEVPESARREIGRDLEIDQQMTAPISTLRWGRDIGDDPLRLIFTAATRYWKTEARGADSSLIGGLTTDEIALRLPVPEPTIAQRIVRAKKTLAEANVPYEVPGGAR